MMRRAVLRDFAIVLACLSVLLAHSPLQAASQIEVEPSTSLVRETVNVGAGGTVHFKFPLTQGVTLVAEFRVEGGLNNRVDVLLLDLPNFQGYSAGQPFSTFQGTSGTITNGAKYQFVIPQTNVYYLIVDNRGALLFARQVDLYVYAISPRPTRTSIAAQQQMEALYNGLRQLFVFPDFRVSIRHCGFENAFSDPNITLCMELIEKLADQDLHDAVQFVLFHELGHTLLRVWGLPGWDNEDMADEFATVFLMLAEQDTVALTAAQWWAAEASEEEVRAKLWVDDRHTLSPQRARNIIRWLNQREDLLRRWQKILVPNMQTEVLKKLASGGGSDDDVTVIRAELARRGVVNQEQGSSEATPTETGPPVNCPPGTRWMGKGCTSQ